MATDLLSTPSTATVAGLFVAGLGAVYAYTQLSRSLGDTEHTHTRAHTHTTRPSTDGDVRKDGEAKNAASTSRNGRKKKKGKGVDVGEGEGGARAPLTVPFPRGVPGSFNAAGAGVDLQEASPAETVSKQGNSKETKKKKKQGKGRDRDQDKEEGSETGKDVSIGTTAAHGLRSGNSTDASASLSPSASASALASSRAMGKGNVRASTRLAPLSQPHTQLREIHSSPSVDTDGSWTHVDHRRLKTSKSADGEAGGLIDMTSSDLASTASDSPVAERTDNAAADTRGARADLVEHTLAEKLVPRPRKTGIDDMLEQPDFPTLARVIRVQPPADETPVPGFSWDDYGDVVEDSLLVHDADQEDEGEWGVVRSRNRTRPPPTTTTTTSASASASISHAPAAPEAMTKKQRQNARKRELAKSAKAEVEVARLEGLAKHKRELERLRIIEQSQQGGGKQPSGGMQAKVDDRGKLVWE